jgi:hypothetical protein
LRHDAPLQLAAPLQLRAGTFRKPTVLISLTLPKLLDAMTCASVSAIHVQPGALVPPGSPLADLVVDLSAVAPQDCAPISYFRLVMSEKAWLRSLHVAVGSEVMAGCCLALFTTTADEPDTGAAARSARATAIEILPDWQSGLW